MCCREVFKELWLVVVVVGVVYGVFLKLVLVGVGWDVSRLIVAGDEFVNSEETVSRITVREDSKGYDGQFYYRMALDPFTSNLDDFGVRLDKPVIRQRRIGYPLLAWVLSLRQARWVPAMLVGINWVGVIVVAGLGGYYAQMVKRSKWWGVVLATALSLLMAVARDLPEVMVSVWLLGFVVAERKRKNWWAGACLLAALLTKETVLAVVGAYGLVELMSKKRTDKKNILVGVVPVVVFGLYHLYLRGKWVEGPGFYFWANVGWPFEGITGFVRNIWLTNHELGWVWLVELAFLGYWAKVVFGVLRQSRVRMFVKLAWLINLGLIACYSDKVWVEDWSFLRAANELLVLGVVIVLESKGGDRRLKEVGLAQVGVWLLVASNLLVGRDL